MDITHVIEVNYASMGNKEKKVAEYVMKNAQELHNITIHELAEILSVAPSTITRFCQRLGCQNFVDFKMRLHANNQPKKELKSGLHQLVTSYYDDVISRTAKLVSEEEIDAVVKAMKETKRILIYGLGSSGLSAEEFRMRLVRMGLQAWSERDGHMIIMGSKMTSETDLIIGISSSGETPEIVEALENAHANGAKTIAMTSVPTSSLDNLDVDIRLFMHNKQFLNEAYFMNRQITALYIIDLITMKLLEDSALKTNIQSTYHRIVAGKH